MDKGWIKFHRKITENHFLMHDETAFVVFTKLLLIVGPLKGQWSGSVRQLGRSYVFESMSYGTFYKALQRLESNQIINQISSHRYTVIEICNWHKYQGSSNQSSKQLGKYPVSNGGAMGNQSAKNNRGENFYKNKKENKNYEHKKIDEEKTTEERASQNTVDKIRMQLREKGITV